MNSDNPLVQCQCVEMFSRERGGKMSRASTNGSRTLPCVIFGSRIFLPSCFVKVAFSRLAVLRVKDSGAVPLWGFPCMGFFVGMGLEDCSPRD